MNNLQKGRAEYQRGMNAARIDRYNCGDDYVRNQYAYGLNGRSATFCKGYADYIKKYINGKK